MKMYCITKMTHLKKKKKFHLFIKPNGAMWCQQKNTGKFVYDRVQSNREARSACIKNKPRKINYCQN